MKKIVKIFVGSMILLGMSDLQAQYTTFKVTGTVEMSVDGKNWHPLKKKEELKGSYQIRLQENSLVDIIDSKNLVYSYAIPKTVSVEEIVKQRKTILETINDNSGKRKAIGGVMRGEEEEEAVSLLLFIDTETLDMYDNWDLIPTESVFYITVYNRTGEDKMVNVYQKLENEELIPCFPQDIWIEKNTILEVKDLLFGKQETNKFVVIQK